MPAQGTPTPPLVAGNSVRNPILQDYVFQSGIHKPEHSSILSFKYPQYYLTSLLDQFGAEESVAQDIYSWNIMDRTREGSTVAAIDTTLPAASVVMDTNFAFTSPDLGYLIVGDLIRVESGAILRVTATQDNGSNLQEITVVKQEGGNIDATDLAVNDTFGHVANAFGEASSAPNGRLYLPTEEYNALQILRRSFKISGSEFTNRTYVGDEGAWYFVQEDLEMREFAMDREAAVMFGKLSTSEPKTTQGIYEYARTMGVNNGFAAGTGVSENDIQEHIKDLLIENVSNDIVVLCGAQFLADAQRALADYAMDGAISFGSFGGNTVGLDFQSYKFMGKTVHLTYYELFDDTAVVPTPVRSLGASAPAADTEVTDFSNFSLWLDFGSDNTGRSLITMKYKELNGQSRKFIHGYEVGMMNPVGENGGQVSNGEDAFSIHLLSHIGIEVRLPNRLGILRATS